MIWEMLTTAGLATGGVTLWTFRVAVTARGNRALGALLAASEAMVFVLAFSKLMGSVDKPHLVLAYGVGVAVGTLAGLALDAKLNPQLARVDIFGASEATIDAITRSGFSFTRSEGYGTRGHVTVASVVTSDAKVKELLDVVGVVEPTSFWTVAPVRRANGARLTGSHLGRPSPIHDRRLTTPNKPEVSLQTHVA